MHDAQYFAKTCWRGQMEAEAIREEFQVLEAEDLASKKIVELRLTFIRMLEFLVAYSMAIKCEDKISDMDEHANRIGLLFPRDKEKLVNPLFEGIYRFNEGDNRFNAMLSVSSLVKAWYEEELEKQITKLNVCLAISDHSQNYAYANLLVVRFLTWKSKKNISPNISSLEMCTLPHLRQVQKVQARYSNEVLSKLEADKGLAGFALNFRPALDAVEAAIELMDGHG